MGVCEREIITVCVRIRPHHLKTTFVRCCALMATTSGLLKISVSTAHCAAPAGKVIRITLDAIKLQADPGFDHFMDQPMPRCVGGELNLAKHFGVIALFASMMLT